MRKKPPRPDGPEGPAAPTTWTAERAALLTSPWFRPLPADALARVEALARRRSLSDGEPLFRRGDAPEGLYGVLKGTVRVFAHSSAGKELLMMQYGLGSWFGEVAVFDGRGRSHDARAVGPAEVLVVPREPFLALLREQPELYPHFLQVLCAKLRMTFGFLEDTQFESVPVRLARRLLDLVVLFARRSPPVIEMSQEELASTLGASRQAVSRELKLWETRGWIELAYGHITIHRPEALHRLANEGDAEIVRHDRSAQT